MLYLTAIQQAARLCANLLPTKTSSAVLIGLLGLFSTYPGGYSIHLRQIPMNWSWIQTISPQRWMFPLLIADEFSSETLANTVANQLCRNKQVRFNIIFKILIVSTNRCCYFKKGSTSGNYCAASMSHTERHRPTSRHPTTLK